jgi:hypothetical protein
MKRTLTAAVVTIGLLSPALAGDEGKKNGWNNPNNPHYDPRGAPAPLLGAGLPGLAIGIGYAAYLFARRRRNVA